MLPQLETKSEWRTTSSDEIWIAENIVKVFTTCKTFGLTDWILDIVKHQLASEKGRNMTLVRYLVHFWQIRIGTHWTFGLMLKWSTMGAFEYNRVQPNSTNSEQHLIFDIYCIISLKGFLLNNSTLRVECTRPPCIVS